MVRRRCSAARCCRNDWKVRRVFIIAVLRKCNRPDSFLKAASSTPPCFSRPVAAPARGTARCPMPALASADHRRVKVRRRDHSFAGPGRSSCKQGRRRSVEEHQSVRRWMLLIVGSSFPSRRRRCPFAVPGSASPSQRKMTCPDSQNMFRAQQFARNRPIEIKLDANQFQQPHLWGSKSGLPVMFTGCGAPVFHPSPPPAEFRPPNPPEVSPARPTT